MASLHRTLHLAGFLLLATSALAAEPPTISGQAAIAADWSKDAPGVRHKYAVDELPAPFATESVTNDARVVPRPPGAQPQVPPGFKIEEYASGFRNPRYLLTAPNGDIFVTESKGDQIRVLRDTDGDGKPDMTEVFAARGLNKPFGLAFYPVSAEPQYLYIANTDGVVRFPYRNGDTKARGAAEKLSAELSAGGLLHGGGHWTRDITFSPDGKKMYVSIGSASNVSDDSGEANRARIFEFNPDGTGQKVFAWGVRNAVGIKFRPGTNELWMSVNERDELGDGLVPDYISRVQPGGFYGWPWYYIGDHQDPRHKGKHPELASKTLVPDVLVQSHSASLNLCFYECSHGRPGGSGTRENAEETAHSTVATHCFPAEYKGDIFAAFHGSWNKQRRTGYKIVRVPFDKSTGKPRGDYEDFVTGFVTPEGNVWGRPVGVTVAKDGSLLFSEDGNDTIWRVSYAQ
ncbi:MAG: PQQ-dependent sugar dehydrogenase [Chthoniobacterales bacterium]